MSDFKEEAESENNPYASHQEKKSSTNCCLLGCLGSVLLVILLYLGGGFGAYWMFKGQVNKYTADAPADLPVVELPEEELAEIEQRVKSFKETVEAGETPDELILTAKEINALIGKDDDMRGRVYVRIEDGLLSGDISLPTDAIPGGKGRFFNASATFDVSLENGVLIVTLADAEVKGEPLPAQFVDAMKQENLAKDAYKDPEVAETLRGFDSISVEGDKIVLKARAVERSAESSDSPEPGVSAKENNSSSADLEPVDVE